MIIFRELVCFNCAFVGHTKRDCPFCSYCDSSAHKSENCQKAECRYCHKQGHNISNCPRIAPCAVCGGKGHKTEKCRRAFLRESLSAPGTNNIIVHEPLAQKKASKEPSASVYPRGPSRVVQLSLDTAPANPTPRMLFPDMTKTILHLTERLYRNEISDSTSTGYASWIQESGGMEQDVHDVLACIDPDMLALSGRVLSPTLFKEVQQRQISKGQTWTANMSAGYADFVLDNRDTTYLRFYVGQSNQVLIRIQTHEHNILDGSDNTLHYYVIRMGEGHRSANFLRLWTIPSSLNDEDRTRKCSLWQNIPECAFCRGFQSLPSDALEDYFGPSDDPARYSSVGLNIIPPILQGFRLDSLQIHKFRMALTRSVDPEIREWPEVRRNQFLAHARVDPKPSASDFKYDGYVNAVSEALGLEGSVLQDLFRSESAGPVPAEASLDELLGITDRSEIDGAAIAYPFGSLDAKIGIVLAVGARDIGGERTSSGDGLDRCSLVLPWGLKECGFTQWNCLIWTSNFRQHSEGSFLGSSRHENSLTRKNHSLIRASNLRVILLCGKHAEEIILGQPDQAHLQGPYCLKLRRHTHKLYVEFVDGRIQRLYVLCPGLFSIVQSRKWIQAQQIGELLRFAAHSTSTWGLRYLFYESSVVFVRVLRRYSLEEQGYIKMTFSDIEPDIRSWLYDKGFEHDNDIVRIEEAAGSLTLGLCMLLHALPRNPNSTAAPLSPKACTGKRKRVSFSTDALQAVKRIFAEVKKARFGGSLDLENEKNATHSRETQLSAGGNDDSKLSPYPQSLINEENNEPYMIDDTVEDNHVDFARIMEEETLEEAGGVEGDEGTVNLTVTALDRIQKKRVYLGATNTQLRSALLNGTARFNGMKVPKARSAKRITIRHVALNLTKSFCGVMSVRADISPGSTHPQVFTKDAGPLDPAKRLGFCVTGQDSDGRVLVEWPKKRGKQAVQKINDLVKWLEE